MNEVFEKTRELGEALLRSDEYMKVKEAENEAMSNKEAAEIVGRFIELRGKMEEIMSAPEKDWTEVQNLTEQIDECKSQMAENEVLSKLDKARDGFSELINQINNVLRFIVTGEMNSEEEGGCTGSCSTCGGCQGKAN